MWMRWVFLGFDSEKSDYDQHSREIRQVGLDLTLTNDSIANFSSVGPVPPTAHTHGLQECVRAWGIKTKESILRSPFKCQASQKKELKFTRPTSLLIQIDWILLIWDDDGSLLFLS